MLDLQDITRELIEFVQSSTDDDLIDSLSHAIAILIPRGSRNQLVSLTKEPVWDGDLISKSDRDYFVSLGLVKKIIYLDKGCGYQAAVFPANLIVKHYYEDSKHRFLVRE